MLNVNWWSVKDVLGARVLTNANVKSVHDTSHWFSLQIDPRDEQIKQNGVAGYSLILLSLIPVSEVHFHSIKLTSCIGS